MISLLPRNIIRFFLLIFLQILIFNNIQLIGYINPYIYILFILLLPFETPRWALLISSFLLGLSIDIFTDTPGVHSFAAVMTAFARPFILSFLSPRDGYESGTFPRMYYFGLMWFIKYTLILTFLHHFAYFYLEIFSYHLFFHTLLRVFLSTMVTSFFLVMSQYFIFRR